MTDNVEITRDLGIRGKPRPRQQEVEQFDSEDELFFTTDPDGLPTIGTATESPARSQTDKSVQDEADTNEIAELARKNERKTNRILECHARPARSARVAPEDELEVPENTLLEFALRVVGSITSGGHEPVNAISALEAAGFPQLRQVEILHPLALDEFQEIYSRIEKQVRLLYTPLKGA